MLKPEKKNKPESTALISLVVASADIKGLMKNWANLNNNQKKDIVGLHFVGADSTQAQHKKEEQNLPVQSLFKTISINIKKEVCVLWSCISICAASMLRIKKIKKNA